MKPASDIGKVIVRLLGSRDEGASICPSEVARSMAGSMAGDEGPWRTLMEPVRAAAAQLAARQIVRVTQGAKEVDLAAPVKGPVRIRRGLKWGNGKALAAEDKAAANEPEQYPATPDGRYFVVRGRLWRKANPSLAAPVREGLVKKLMDARRALRGRRPEAERTAARAQVDEAKQALGERGPVWWTDGAPDFNRHMAKNTPYRDWFAALPGIPGGPD
ncbi:MAG: DUF3253 domain-containing protein [Comamonadaceae bacterium]|nr:MAG: DUF3253 domain-containing protein [Comamonadaceae bacterium]